VSLTKGYTKGAKNRLVLGTGTEPTKAMRKELPNMGAQAGDDRGHLIAKVLGGKGGKTAGNIVPIAENLNSTMGAVERAVKADVESGINVQMTVQLTYNPENTTMRPDFITYIIDGGSKSGTYGPFPNK
jgi:hypothetical protein